MNIVQRKVWLALDAQQTAAQQKENKNNKQQPDIKIKQKPTKFYDNHNSNQEKKITWYTKSLKSKTSLQENQSGDLPVAGQEHEKVQREANKPNCAAVLFGWRSFLLKLASVTTGTHN